MVCGAGGKQLLKPGLCQGEKELQVRACLGRVQGEQGANLKVLRQTHYRGQTVLAPNLVTWD